MQKFAGGNSNAVYDIVIDDGSWIYGYDPKTKRQSAQWMFDFEELSTKVKRGGSVEKKMMASFFEMTGSKRLQARRRWSGDLSLPKIVKKITGNYESWEPPYLLRKNHLTEEVAERERGVSALLEIRS